MPNRELIAELQDLGLTKYQSQAYVAAVDRGRARPSELVDASDVPQGRIYDVIGDLEDLGFVEIRSRGGEKEVVAPPPSTVLEDLERRRVEELSATVDALTSELDRRHGDRDDRSDGFVTMVTRQETALRHARRAIEAADWWLTLSGTVELYDQLEPYLREAIADGVTVRFLLSGEGPDGGEREFPDDLRVRYRSTVDTYVVADRAYGIFSSKHPAQANQQYIITQEPNLVLLFQNHLETIWGTSTPVWEHSVLPRRYLDPWRVIIYLRDDLERGAEYEARVVGQTTDTRRNDAWTGSIVGLDLTDVDDETFTAAHPTIASLEMTVDGETLSVGGWKATVEDVAAEGIELLLD